MIDTNLMAKNVPVQKWLYTQDKAIIAENIVTLLMTTSKKNECNQCLIEICLRNAGK